MDLQELITRGRLIFSKAPERLKVFELVNGKRNTREIAKLIKRHVNNIRRDLQLLSDGGLIQPKVGKDGNTLRTEGFPVYEKVPLARTISISYFRGPIRLYTSPSAPQAITTATKATKSKKPKPLPIPTEQEILDICRHGEDQVYEFKAPGVDASKLAKEIAGFLNTRQGGIVFYGVEDDGTIVGTDLKPQVLDQRVQNAVHNTVKPAAHIQIKGLTVMGTEIVLIVVQPWNRKDVYQYEGRVYIRKGTNVFVATPEESKKLHKGEHVA